MPARALPLAVAALLLIALAGCGASDTESTESQRATATAASGDDGATDTTTAAASGDDSASSEGINLNVELCDASQLTEMASDLWPGYELKCYDSGRLHTRSVQSSGATWSSEKIPDTGVIGSNHVLQAAVVGAEPDPGSSTDAPEIDPPCHLSINASIEVECHEARRKIDGSDCLLQTLTTQLESGATHTGGQVDCYVERDPDTGLDVKVSTVAVGGKVGFDGLADFTAAVMGAARDD